MSKAPLPPPLALTMGEPAGVGPRLALEAWRSRKDRKLPVFAFIGDPRALEATGEETPFQVIEAIGQAAEAFEHALPVLAVRGEGKIRPGEPDPANTPAVVKAVEIAVKHATSGAAAGVVTGPVHKRTMIEGGFAYAGHTEFLGRLTGAVPVMMLANRHLRAVPVTGHIPLREVLAALSAEKIVATARIVSRELGERFGIARPRLAATGLNPHAGEEGKLGSEEADIITPALERLRQEGISIIGPLPADSAFTEAGRKRVDAFLAMTHDQALIPVKALDFRGCVNVTLGLPIVRTSPAHGTALDLIKSGGKADPESLIQAILTAAKLARAGG